jgi:hypothetical protein
MGNGSITHISLKANEELIKRTKQKSTRRFWMVGKESFINKAEKGKPADWVYEGIDFISTFAAMSKREQTLVVLFKDNILWDKVLNTYQYAIKFTPDDVCFDQNVDDFMAYNSFLKAFGLLYKKDLMRRVLKSTYMLNPEFFPPVGEQSPYFQRLWDESKPCKDNT